MTHDPTNAELSVQDLLARYAAGERRFQGVNLRGAHLGGADLRGADLRGADLTSATLPSAQLSSVDLTEAKLGSAWLAGAELRGANLTGADLSDASSLTVNPFDGIIWQMMGESYATSPVNLAGALLRGACLDRAVLGSAVLTGADLAGASLLRTQLQRAVLTHAVLSDADLEDAKLFKANLRGADLRKANLARASLYGATLDEANVEGADLRDADLTNVTSVGAIGLEAARAETRPRPLAWAPLPPGEHPWQAIEEHYRSLLRDSPKGVRGDQASSEVDLERLRVVHALGPDACYVGPADELRGYAVFVFERRGVAICECPFVGNAAYVLRGDWRQLSRLSKRDLLERSQERVVHSGNWKQRITRALDASD
jgi:uncharacterized protein YjbI with pentapeptide repeats